MRHAVSAAAEPFAIGLYRGNFGESAKSATISGMA